MSALLLCNEENSVVCFCTDVASQCQKVKVLPAPMAHRAAPISVSVALGHASANAVGATAGGWSTGSSTSLTFPPHSHMSSTR